MSYEKWVADAQGVVDLIPKENPVHLTADALVSEVAIHGKVIDNPADFGLTDVDIPSEDSSFPVVSLSDISKDKTQIPATDLPRNFMACVLYGTAQSALILPKYASKPTANGMIALHELTHITQDGSQFVEMPDYAVLRAFAVRGEMEREAYGLNADIIRAIDGSDFDEYLDSWPIQKKIIDSYGGEQHGSITFQEGNPSWLKPYKPFWENRTRMDKFCNAVHRLPRLIARVPRPPKDTFAHELWDESHTSKELLRSICRVAIAERTFAGTLDEAEINRTVGYMTV